MYTFSLHDWNVDGYGLSWALYVHIRRSQLEGAVGRSSTILALSHLNAFLHVTMLASYEYKPNLLDAICCSRLVLDEYGRHQSRLATTIFKAMAENLNLDQNLYESYLSPSTASMRIYRYLECPLPVWGLNAHTDSTVLTVLTHDEVGGFQVCKGDDEWIDVEPIPNTLVLILGDLIQVPIQTEF